MIEPLQYHAAVNISRLWIRANPTGWFQTHDAAQAIEQRLLVIIHRRYLQLRDDVAREAFDTREDAGVIAWKRAQRMAAERCGGPGFSPVTAGTGGQVPEIRSPNPQLIGAGRE